MDYTTAPEDFYVEVLDVADDWYDLSEQKEEPSEADWTRSYDRLDAAVEALRAYESEYGIEIRTGHWGGVRAETFEVIDAADAYIMASYDLDTLSEDERDAALDRLGDAVAALRIADAVPRDRTPPR